MNADEARHGYRRSILIWVALMALLLLTFSSAYVKMGAWNSVVNLGIAAAKAALVAIFFMHLRTAPSLLRLAAVTALLTLALLFGLSHADYATRDMHRVPWQTPQARNLDGTTIGGWCAKVTLTGAPLTRAGQSPPLHRSASAVRACRSGI